jgi:ATP-dependent Clp protease ATP-binding subunit ClpA
MTWYNEIYEKYAGRLPPSYLKQLKHRMETGKVRGVDVMQLPGKLKAVHPAIEEAFKADTERYAKLRRKKGQDQDEDPESSSESEAEAEDDSESDKERGQCSPQCAVQQKVLMEQLKDEYIRLMKGKLKQIRDHYEEKLRRQQQKKPTKQGTNEQLRRMLTRVLEHASSEETRWNNRLLNHSRCLVRWFTADETAIFRQFRQDHLPLADFADTRNQYLSYCEVQLELTEAQKQHLENLRQIPTERYNSNLRATLFASQQ